MRRLSTAMVLAGLLLLPMAGHATANHPHYEDVQGPNCGARFKDADRCSFRYTGGQLYVGTSVRGRGLPEGAASVRLEAVSSITGQRRVLLSCTTPASGGCSTAGSYDPVEHVRKGQRLFCIVEGAGRGTYECGTVITRKAD